jgi:hypothetical protein
VDEFVVKEKICQRDCYKIIFKFYIVFNHLEIVKKFLDSGFAKSVGGAVTLKSFVVTKGGFETMDGFQYSAFGSFPQDPVKERIEHSGTEYPMKLAMDECISRLNFVLATPARSYSMVVFSNCIEIRPPPPRQIIRICIRGLKEALVQSPKIFLQSARARFESGLLDFMAARYRSVPHNIYYAAQDLVKCLCILSDEGPSERLQNILGHDKRLQNKLTDLLIQISSGEHKRLTKSSRWKEEKGRFHLIDSSRYSKLITDLYEMRITADYKTDFEMVEYIPELSRLMLEIEELFTLVMYVESEAVATYNGTLVRIFEPEREMEPLESLAFRWLKREKSEFWILQKGVVLAEGFDLKKLLIGLLRRKNIYYSPFRPSPSRKKWYLKCEKKEGVWTHSMTLSERIAKEEGYLPYTAETIKKLSQITKADEMLSLERNRTSNAENAYFSDGKYEFELCVFSDGRFFLFSPLEERNAADQMNAVLKLREIMAKNVSSLWKFQSTISFAAITIM